jgi:hypothetical protein
MKTRINADRDTVWKRELALFLNKGFTDELRIAGCIRLCHERATRGTDVEGYVHRMLDKVKLRPRQSLALALWRVG